MATGTPVVLIAISGRPYALGFATGAAAMVQTFFPGQLGGQALAEVLTGEVSPSGRLPVSLPRDPSDGPGTYLAPPLAGPTDVSNLDPRPLFPFGHGRGYTTTEWGAVTCESTEWASDGEVELSLEVVNTSARHLGDVVQVYLHDPVAQVTRPTMRLIAFQRVDLPPGERAEISFTLHADLTSFAGLDGARVVETGQVELRIARSVEDVHAVVPLVITGVNRRVGIDRHLAAISGVRTGPGQLKEVTIA